MKSQFPSLSFIFLKLEFKQLNYPGIVLFSYGLLLTKSLWVLLIIVIKWLLVKIAKISRIYLDDTTNIKIFAGIV